MKKLTLSFILILSLTFSYAESLQNNTSIKPWTHKDKIIEHYGKNPNYELKEVTDNLIVYKAKDSGPLFNTSIWFHLNDDGEMSMESLVYEATEYLSDELFDDFFVKIYNNYLSRYNLELKEFNLYSNSVLFKYNNVDSHNEQLSFIYSKGDNSTNPRIYRSIMFYKPFNLLE